MNEIDGPQSGNGLSTDVSGQSADNTRLSTINAESAISTQKNDTNDKIKDENDIRVADIHQEGIQNSKEDIEKKQKGENSTVKVPQKRKRKRKKVSNACVYCRRSHMICDPGRPCQRCIKRNIGHLCRDDVSRGKKRKSRRKESSDINQNTQLPSTQQASASGARMSSVKASGAGLGQPQIAGLYNQTVQGAQPGKSVGYAKSPELVSNAASAAINQRPFFYSEHAGSEFNSLTEFLSMIDDADVMNTISMDDDPMLRKLETTSALGYSANNSSTNLNGQQSIDASVPGAGQSVSNFRFSPMTPGAQIRQSEASQSVNGAGVQYRSESQGLNPNQNQVQSINQNQNQRQSQNPAVPYVSDVARAKFFLTAADPTTEISPEERLKQVINAKLEAGLLKPYNYARGYQRLQTYMDNHMAASSRQRILKPLSLFRPGFRAIAKSLKDIDLILVEENFERMLLDYDRVFTSMAIPACLWRRTGEIYRGNKEFASLVEVSIDDLKNGKLTIYELMTEESSVNFWEKYGAIAFDKTQKAVLTSCNLRTKDGMRKQRCCFSFTIRRDKYNIPSCIVGNFIPIQ